MALLSSLKFTPVCLFLFFFPNNKVSALKGNFHKRFTAYFSLFSLLLPTAELLAKKQPLKTSEVYSDDEEEEEDDKSSEKSDRSSRSSSSDEEEE